ncbi:MAG: DUF2846 domain-containing protein [Verrucomicrobiota bacterium]
MKKLSLLILLASLTGCASVSKQATNVYPEPKEDKGLVYFFRENKFAGWAISYNIRHNNQIIGAISNGTYFYHFSEPGTQTFTSKTESEVSRTLDIVGGETYYIKMGVDMGFWAGRPSMAIVTEMEGKSVLPGLTFATKPQKESSSREPAPMGQ